MAPKSCVYCSGELAPLSATKKGKDGLLHRRFVCKLCMKTQVKVLDPNDPWVKPQPHGKQKKPAPHKQSGARTASITSSKEVTPKVPHRRKLPVELANAKPTPKSLAAHHYQRKLAAHYAPQILPSTFEGLRDGVEAGNTTAIKMVLELYELVQTDKRISIVNDNRSVTVNAGGEAREGGVGSQRRSFESIARQLDASRDKRIAEGNPLATRILDAEFVETPEGMSK